MCACVYIIICVCSGMCTCVYVSVYVSPYIQMYAPGRTGVLQL